MRREKLPLSLIGIFLAFLCCTLASSQLAQAADDGSQPPPFRLPTTVAPRHYSLNITVAPDQDTFKGSVEIELNFKEATSVLWLNADKLTVSDATLTVGSQTLKAKVLPQPKDLVGFSFEHPVGPGPANLHVN
jgi:alanyl aminopeptidase